MTYRAFSGPSFAYDADDEEEKNRCRRVVDAYSVQLKNDPDQSRSNGHTPYLEFVACSGSRFDDIGDQFSRLTYVPKLATLTVGGNDTGFFDVVSNCVFQQESGDNYKLDYPDPASRCTQSIDNAKNNIGNDLFKQKLFSAYHKISQNDLVTGDENFKVFLTGYAAFFNQIDTKCNAQTFSPIPTSHRQKITIEVRTAINDLVRSIKKLYNDTVVAAADPRLIFVPINNAFKGHRSCEDALNPVQQQSLSYFFTFQPILSWSCDPDFHAACVADVKDVEKQGDIGGTDLGDEDFFIRRGRGIP